MDATVYLDANGNVSISVADVDNGTVSNCPNGTVTVSPNSFTCSEVGANTVQLIVSDQSGNSDTATAIVTVVDTISPNALTQPVTIFLDQNGQATLAAADVNDNSSDACGIASMNLNQTSFDCTDLGASSAGGGTPVSGTFVTSVAQFNHSLGSGYDPNTNEFWFPTWAGSTVNRYDATTRASLGSFNVPSPDQLMQVWFDNTSGTDYYLAHWSGYSVTRRNATGGIVWTYNLGYLGAGVTTDDQYVYTYAYNQNYIRVLDKTTGAFVSNISVGGNMQCYGGLVHANGRLYIGGYVGFGNHPNNWAAVTVVDAVTGAFIESFLLSTSTSSSGLAFDGENLWVGNGSTSFAHQISDGNVFGGGAGADVQLVVTDVNGNTDTASAVITVVDSLAPTVIANDVTVSLDANGNASITLADVNGGVSDNCIIQDVYLSGNAAFNCSHVGANAIYVVATDSSGNIDSSMATVTVIGSDNDADGIPDVCDLDDDNDGITDLEECPPAEFFWSNPPTLNGNSATGTINGVNYTYNSSSTVQTEAGYQNHGIFPASFAIPNNNPIMNLDATNNTLVFDQPLLNPTLAFASIGNASLTVAVSFSDSVELIFANNTTLTAFNQISGTEGHAIVRFVGVYDSISFNYSAFENRVNFGFGADFSGVCDADGDGIQNQFDLDSDGDNCADALEAGHQDDDNDGLLGNSPVTVDANGLVLNQGGYTGTTALVNDSNQNVCNQPPVAVCQNITINTGANCDASITANDVDGGSSDPDGDVLSYAINNSGPFGVGTHTVTLTVTDPDGESDACTATVTVVDATPPTAICQNISVQLDANGNASITAADINNGSNDACGIAAISVSPSSFTCANVGTNTVTLTVTDIHGNIDTCSATVTVDDATPVFTVCVDPAITYTQGSCSAVVTYPNSASGLGVTGTYVLSGATTGSGLGDGSGLTYNLGTTIVTIFATNACGVDTCNVTVVVADTTAPTAICQNLTIQLDASGNASITAADVDNGSNDACGIASLAIDNGSFTCANVGPNTVTLTVTDNNGNTSTCTSTITVEDNVLPNAIAQDLTIQLDANGAASITAIDIDNGSNDACGIAALSVSPSSFACGDVGANTVTLTVTDNNNNVSTTTATVTVEDNTAPVITNCPVDMVLNNTLSNCLSIVSWMDPTVSDNCGAGQVAMSYSAPGINIITITNVSFANFPVGTTTVTATATDANGNSTNCFFDITIVDVEAPIITGCPASDVIVSSESGQCDAVVTWQPIVPSDNCPGVSLTASHLSGTVFPVGTTVVTYDAVDAVGNTAQCTFNVVVQDNEAPAAICQDLTIQLDASGNASITAADVDNGSNDACGIAALSVSPSSFTCANVGANTVTLTVTDVNGNVSTCTSTVTVEDNVAPNAIAQDITVQLDASGNVSITAADVDNGSNDACAITLAASPTSFTCSEVGANTVTLTVTDASGNVSTATSTVTVEDNVAPTAICQDITVQLDASGNVSITAADVDNGSNDACGVTLAINNSSFTCANVGANTVTLTVTDANGNASTCTSTVIVEDNVAPTAICQDITVQLDASGNVSITAADVDNGSNDACGVTLAINNSSFTCANVGANTVTLTVTDANGNASTCTSTVTVEDNVAPNAIAQDITVQLDASGNVSITAADIDNGSNDACGISISASPTSFTCAEVGANTVTLTVTDANGNVSIVTATVTVEDNVAPVVITQNATVYLDANGQGSISTSDIDNGSNDACGISSLSLNQTSFDCADVSGNCNGSSSSLYWSTIGNSGQVIGSDLQGNNQTVVATNQTTPVGIAYDETNNLLYWSDNQTGKVYKANGDGTNVSVLDSNLLSPFDVAIDVSTQTLYYSDNVGIYSNNTAGTARVTIVGSQFVTGLFLDEANNHLYYSNYPVEIRRVDLDGTNNILVESNTAAFDLYYISSSSELFWTDISTGDVFRKTGTNPKVSIANNSTSGGIFYGIFIDEANSRLYYTDVNSQLVISSELDGTNPITIYDGSAQFAQPIYITLGNNGGSSCNTNSVSLTVTDVNGNSSIGNAIVTVVDTIAPVASCMDITVQLDALGNASITAADVDGGSSDACGVDSIAIDVTSFTCANVGPNTVTLSVFDVNGNSSTCTATVTVEDNVAPIAIAQDITVQLDASGNVSITAADIDNGSNDACGVTLAASPTSFTCAEVGANTVTLTVTDANGNVSTTTSTVIVEDNVAPTAICQDITVQLDASGNVSITAADVDNGSNDACGVTLAINNSSFTCANVGANTVTLTVTDANGNASTCTSTVTVEDNVAPIAIAQDITVQLDASGNVSITAADIDNGSNDACGITIAASPTSFTCAEVGSNTVTLTVTDANGNVSTTTSTVTVEDNIAPTAICQDITVQLDASGNVSITAADVDNGSNDACGVTLAINNSSFTCANVGANTVTLTVTDANGNASTCTSTVTVEDNVVPNPIAQDITVQLDASGNVSITPGDIDNGSNDACGIASLAIDLSSFTCSEVGPNTVTLTVTDNNGNVSTTNAIVTVEDNVAPIAIAQDITVQLDATGNVSITAADVDNGSNDACGVSLAVSPSSFTCSEVGANTVTLTVTDPNSNVSTTTSTVTVEDNVAPAMLCNSFTATLDNTGMAVITTAQVDGGSSDACGIASISIDKTSFNCQDVGNNVVTLTATDVNGNVATCTAIIYVEDPTLQLEMSDCQDDITLTCENATDTVWFDAPTVRSISNLCGISCSPADTLICNVSGHGNGHGHHIHGHHDDDDGHGHHDDDDGNGHHDDDDGHGHHDDDDGGNNCSSSHGHNSNGNSCHGNRHGHGGHGNGHYSHGNGHGYGHYSCQTVCTYANPADHAIPGYTFLGRLGDKKYYVSNSKYNYWSQAEALASNYGGHLAVINSQAENDFIEDAVDNDKVWIGLSDHVTEGSYNWTNGDPLSYTNWDKNEPKAYTSSSKTGKRDYTVMYKKGKWRMKDYNSRYKYVMEVPCNNSRLSVRQIAGLPSGSVFPVGNTTVSFVALDSASGLSDTCSFVVSVEADITAPTIRCKDAIVTLDATTGLGSLPASAIHKWSYDDCSGVASMTASQTSFDLTDVGVNQITLTVTDSAGNAATCIADVTVIDPNAISYCNASGNSYYEWIQSISVSGNTNNSGNDGGYGNYTASPIQLNTGYNSLTLTPGYRGRSYKEYWRVWIDYNNDGDFNDWGECVYQKKRKNTVYGSFNISSSKAGGTYTMRIGMRYGSYPNPCGYCGYGEYEDYKVTISGGQGRVRNGGETFTALEDESIKEVTLYPNPNNGNFSLQFEGEYTSTIQVIVRSVDGKLVYNKTISPESFMNRLDIDVSTQAKGMYIMQIREGDYVKTMKFNKF